jgi:hypothetical protein
MFHDESKQIVRRNKGRVSDAVQLQNMAHEPTTKQALVRAAAARPIRLTDVVLYQPLEDLGVSFFMSTYVSDGELE